MERRGLLKRGGWRWVTSLVFPPPPNDVSGLFLVYGSVGVKGGWKSGKGKGDRE